MNSEYEPNGAEEDLPPFSWRRTCLLLLVAWAVGSFLTWKTAPHLPWPLIGLVGLIGGVVIVGLTLRIF